MAKLSEVEKHEIVRLVAHYTPTRDVVAHMRDYFGVEIDRFQVRAYDPTNPRFEGGERWRAIFEAERAAYLRSIEDIPIAHKAFRLNQLQNMLFKAQASGNLVLSCAILEQAAKEVGGALTNERKIDMEREEGGWRAMTSEERREAVTHIIREALERERLPIAA